MNGMKRILLLILALTMLLTATATSADDKESITGEKKEAMQANTESIIIKTDSGEIKISPENIIKKTIEDFSVGKTEEPVQLEPIIPRRLSPEKDQPITRAESKLSEQVKLDKEAGKSSIPIVVILQYDVDDIEEKFEKEFASLFGDSLKYEKLNIRKYKLNVNVEQLELLEGMDEVRLITIYTDAKIRAATVNKSSGDVTIKLNAGSKKSAP